MTARSHQEVDASADPENPVALGYLDRARVLVAACSVRRDLKIFLVAGRTLDGRTVYIDERVPVIIAGVDTNLSLPWHELGELLAMNDGLPYDDDGGDPNAHFDVANPLERREVERQRPGEPGAWGEYCREFYELVGTIDADEVADVGDLPDGFDMRPIEQDPAGKSATAPELGYNGRALHKARGRGETDTMTTPASAAEGTLRIFVPITKVDAAKRLVYGTVAAEVADKSGEIMDYASAKPEFEKWSGEIAKNSDGKSAGNLRAMHSNIAAGKLNSLSFDDDGRRIETVAKVVDDNEWNKVVEGVYTGFSMGGSYGKRWKDPSNPELTRYTPTDIVEVSLVDNPCIPTATFDYIKADGTKEMRKFVTAPAADATPSNDEVFARATELAKGGTVADHLDAARAELVAERLAKRAPAAAATTPVVAGALPGNDAIAARAADLAKAGGGQFTAYLDKAREELIAEGVAKAAAATVETVAAATATGAAAAPATAAGSPREPAGDDVEQVWKARDGSTHKTKAAAKAHNVDVDATAAAAKAAAPALDALKGVTAALDKLAPEAGKSTVSAPATATSGLAGYALDGAKKREYTDAQRKDMAAKGTATRDGSIAIADAADIEDAVKAYGQAKNKTAAKRFITRRARALKATDQLPEDWAGSTKGKKGAEADELRKAAAAGTLQKGNLYLVGGLIQTLASLESYEESYEQSGSYFDASYKPAPELTTRFGALLVEFGDLVADILDECLGGMKDEEAGEAMALAAPVLDLMKAGARHSAADKGRLQKIHDHSVEMGADCKSTKAAEGDDLTKVTAERDALTKAMSAVTDGIATLNERIAKLEKSPATGPTVGKYTVVGKTDDSGGTAGTAEALRASDGRLLTELSRDELAREVIKASQRHPMTLRHGGDGSINDRFEDSRKVG